MILLRASTGGNGALANSSPHNSGGLHRLVLQAQSFLLLLPFGGETERFCEVAGRTEVAGRPEAETGQKRHSLA